MRRATAPPGIAGRARLTTRPPSGLSRSALSILALAVASLAYTATVSRLLEPTALGLMAIAKLRPRPHTVLSTFTTRCDPLARCLTSS
jgi:hypothetical protein